MLRIEETKELLETHSISMTAKIMGLKANTIRKYRRMA